MKIIKTKDNWGIILAVVVALFDLYMIAVKLRFGLHWDEPFLIAQAECFTRNIDFFKDSWSAFQFAGIIVAPLSWIYGFFVGSNQGIIYFFRIIWLIMQNVLAYVAYRTLKYVEIPSYNGNIKVPCFIAACSSICLYCYFAYFYSVNYKTLAFWGCSFILLILIDCYRNITAVKSIFLGMVLSCTVLSYESTVVMLIPILFCFRYISKETRNKTSKYCLVFIFTCMVCAGIFIGYVIMQIGLIEFLQYFPKLFGYEGYEQNVLIKIAKHAIYFSLAFVANYVVVMVHKRWMKEKITLSKFLLVYLFFLIIFIMFARPQSITISRVNYIMCILYTLCSVLILVYADARQKKYYLNLYIIPIGFYVLSIAIATYQGIAVSSMGCILAIIPMFLLASEGQLKMRGIIGVVTVMMMAVGSIVVPCVYTTNLTVFHYTEEITDGPAKGIRPLDTYVNENIAEWQKMVDKYVVDTDIPLMLGNEYYSVGYLYSDVNEYGTYSPGYVFLDSDRLVDFWNTNTERQPTIAIIKIGDLPCNFEEFLSNYPIGIYLNNLFDSWSYDGGYAVARIPN